MTRTDRAAFWHGHVVAWRSGNESQSAYCRRLGLSIPTFSQWKRHFEQQRLERSAGTADSGETQGSSAGAALLAVELDAAELARDRGHADGDAGVSVELASGLRLRLTSGFDAAALERAITVLADAGC